jgi:hypothetical protein
MLPDDYAIVKDQIAPCGIRCSDCDLGNGSVAETAMGLMNYIKRYDLPSWAHELPGGDEIDFKRFDHDLIWVGKWLRCPGCLRGGGNSNCPIRLCSKEKGYSSCSQCDDLKSCTRYAWLGEKGEMLKNRLAEEIFRNDY